MKNQLIKFVNFVTFDLRFSSAVSNLISHLKLPITNFIHKSNSNIHNLNPYMLTKMPSRTI